MKINKCKFYAAEGSEALEVTSCGLELHGGEKNVKLLEESK